jgi:ATP-dependent DNA helicase RecG
MTREEILTIISQGETETVEFKQSFSKAVIETLVAFSNSKGGKVLVGIKNNKTIYGISTTEETIQKWINEIKQNTEPAIIPKVNSFEIDNKTIAVFSVSEFPIKPVSFKDRFYIRKQNANHKIGAAEIAELRYLSLNYSFDAFSVETPFENLNKDALNLFTEKIKKSGRYKSFGNIKSDFNRLGLIKNNKLTRACELLFDHHHTNIHVGRFKSKTVIIDDLLIRSPLIMAVEETLDFIKKNIRLGFEFGGDGLQRTEKWQYPIPALRELILNAIIHRDYTNPTDVIIKIFDESIEITNPGSFIDGLTIDDILSDNYIPKHRNKLLTEVFYLTGDIEKYGTGFSRVREWFAGYQNLDFKIKDLVNFIQVIVYNKGVGKDVGKGVGKGVGKDLTELQKSILKLVELDNKITIPILAEKLNTTTRTIERNMEKLKKIHLINRIGSRKDGYWEIK